MGSTRLPGKVLMLLDKKHTTLDYVINQLKHSKLLGKIIIATTNFEEDDVIADFARNNDIEYFRGESDDVLDRYYHCAEKFSLNTIVRITSDEPFVDPTIVDQLIINFQKLGCDYASNNLISTFPAGFDVEVFSIQTLERTWRDAKLPSEREHVTPYLLKNKNLFKHCNCSYDRNLSHIRCTVDTKDDFKLIEKIISKIDVRPIHLDNILELILNEPDLLEINKHIKHDGYERSLKEDNEFLKNSD